MTKTIVKALMDRAVTDDEFRDLSLAGPDRMPEYDLAPVEIEGIKRMELTEEWIRFLSLNLAPRGHRFGERHHLTQFLLGAT